jgi:ubiquitin carboxyl-terminal hydrolase 48
MEHSVKCLRCGYVSSQVQPFLEVDVNIIDNMPVEDCLSATFKEETLSGDNKYRCQRCHSLQNAKKWTTMRILPPILNLSLMRFQYTASGRKKSKAKIKYKKGMRAGGVDWKLKAAVIHVGTSVSLAIFPCPFGFRADTQAHHGHFICDVYDEE